MQEIQKDRGILHRKRALGPWTILAFAATTVGGIKCEFAELTPTGEVKILKGPLNFKKNKDAIEDILRECVRKVYEELASAHLRFRDIIVERSSAFRNKNLRLIGT